MNENEEIKAYWAKKSVFNTTPRVDTEYEVVIEFKIKTIGTREQAIEYAAHARKFLKLQLSRRVELTRVQLLTMTELSVVGDPPYAPFIATEEIDVRQVGAPEL